MGVLLLFDIDLTLIRTQGAGGCAMTETALALLGIDDAFAGVEFAGRSDRAIVRDALRRHGCEPHDFEAFLAAFQDDYCPRLERLLGEVAGALLPGVPAILAAAAQQPDVRLGLATGNFRRAAAIKLRHFGLWEHFLDGGFADDGEERADLVAAAIHRLSNGWGPAERVVVFGDSPHDIAAARANGSVAVGVATGASSVDHLLALGADHVFADLSDPESVLATVLPARP